MVKKNVRKLHRTKLLFIFTALLIIYTTSFAQTENSNTESNIQKTLQIQHIDPNTAAKVVKTIIKLKIFEISKETLIVPDSNSNSLTIQAETSDQMALIAEIVKNIDFEVINEGMTGKRYIQLEKLVFDDIYKTISPIFSNYGHASYNITSHMLEVTEITGNLDNFENLIIKLDTDGFYYTDSATETEIIDTTIPVEPNQDNAFVMPEQIDTNSVEVKAPDANEPMIVVQFHGFGIEQIAERLQQWTGKEIIPSQEAMNLRFSVFAPQRMNQSDAIALLYTAIRQQGFSVEETDDTIFIKTAPQEPDNDILSYDEPLENIQDKEKVVGKIYQLQYENPSTIGQLISSYLSPLGYFATDDTKKTLLVSDSVKYLIRIEEMIKVFDADPDSGIIISPVNPIEPSSKEIQSADDNDPLVDINLSNAGINQIIDTLIRLTDKAVLPSNEALSLEVSISSPKRIRQSEAIQLLSDSIKKKDFTLELINNIIYIKPASLKKKSKIYPSGFDEPNGIKDQNGIKNLDTSNINNSAPMVDVNIVGLNIDEIAEILQAWTGKKVVPSPEAMSLRFTLFAQEKAKRSLAIALLYNAIRLQGFNTEETDGTIFIKKQPFQLPTSILIADAESVEDIQDNEVAVQEIFTLYRTKPMIMGQLILPYLSPSGYFTADNFFTLMIYDKVKNLKQIEQMIMKYDSDPSSHPKYGYVYLMDPDDPLIDVNISNFKIDQIIQILQEWTGKKVVPSQDAMILKVTLYSPEKIKRSEAIKMLYSSMRQYGFEAEEIKDTIYINFLPQKNNRALLLDPNIPLDNIKDQDIVVRVIFKLKNYNSAEMGKRLIPHLNHSANIIADTSSNALMVTDTVAKLKELELIIKQLDSHKYDPNDPMVPVNLSGLKIEQIKQILSLWTGKKVESSEEATGLYIYIYSPEIMKQSDAINLLYSAIRQQGFVVENRNDILYIVPVSALGLPHYEILDQNTPLDNIEDQNKVARIIFKLKYNSPANIREILLPLLSESGNITADETTKSLYIIDTVKKLKQYKEIIEKFDSKNPISSESSILFAIPDADPNEIANIINLILKQQADPNSLNYNRTGRTGRTKKQADSNSIPQENVIINTIDPNENAQTQEHETVYVKYINADIAAQRLKGILDKLEIDTKSELIILPLATSNQILVFGEDTNDRQTAESLIHDIDYQAAEDNYDFENISLNYIEPQAFTNFTTNTIEEFKNLRLSLYPIESSKQVLVFGEKEYRDVIREYVKDIDKPLENIEPEALSLKNIDSAQKAVTSNILLKVFEVQQRDSIEFTKLLDAIIMNKMNNDPPSSFEANCITLIPWPGNNWIFVRAPDEAMNFIGEWINFLNDENPDIFINPIFSEIEDPNKVVTKIYTIKYNAYGSISKLILPLLSSSSCITTEEDTGTLIITDRVSVLLQVEKIISDFDFQEQNDQEVAFDPMENSSFSINQIKIDRIVQVLMYCTNKAVIPSKIAMGLTITGFISRSMSRSEILNLFKKAIKEQGFILDESEDVIYIKAVHSDSNDFLQRKVFEFNYANAKYVKTKLDELFGNGVITKPGDVFFGGGLTNIPANVSEDMIITIANPPRNELIVLAPAEKMKVIEKQVSEWDSPIELSPFFPRIYTINHVDKNEIVEFLSSFFSSSDNYGDNTSNDTLTQSPVIEMFKDKISFLNIPETKEIAADSQIIEGYRLIKAIINEIDKTELVPFDSEKARNIIRENLKNIEKSIK